MKAAFVIMSILGCNDAGTQCVPVASVAEEWQTVKACDSASEKILTRYQNVPHPVVVAVCQTAETTALDDSAEEVAETSMLMPKDVTGIPAPPKSDRRQGFAKQAIELLRDRLPATQTIMSTFQVPVHFVTGTYSWVAKKITN